MAWYVLSFCLGWYSIDHSSGYDKHPRHAEAVGDHAEARRKKSFRHGHLYLASLSERGKQPFRLNFIRYRERQRKALEARLALAVAIGSHDCRVSQAQRPMHDFVFRSWRQHARRTRLGRFFETHEHGNFGTERAAVEIKRLLATAIEEQIRLDQHGFSLPGLNARFSINGD